MKQYIDLMDKILEQGEPSDNRTGVKTLALFGEQLKFDLAEGFPLLTTKEVWFKGVLCELLWFISGSTNIEYLVKANVHIWDEWADELGEVGPAYGHQWRAFGGNLEGSTHNYDPGADQLARVIRDIQTNPTSRRLIVTAWDPGTVDQCGLPPCHLLFQFAVRQGALHCHVYMRSADYFLGVPFNIASYALLTELVATVTGLDVGTLTMSFGDVHLYTNHLEQALIQRRRLPRPLPGLAVKARASIDDFEIGDIQLAGYDPHPKLAGKVAV